RDETPTETMTDFVNVERVCSKRAAETCFFRVPAGTYNLSVLRSLWCSNCKKFFICEPYEVHFALRIITQQLFCTNQSCQLVCFCQLLRSFLLQALEIQIIVHNVAYCRAAHFNFSCYLIQTAVGTRL